ncbi:lycopene cyclase domain-containing protein [Glutamicibacter sp.]|uniref:lycopene cyclase domain-containing protein n=1 Tax=Glutamicibacter sp. TaxID=1931995 RepID=UPI003D6BD7D6
MIYLGILLVLLACMGLLDAKGKLFLFRHPVRGFLALGLGTGFFVLWDVLAIRQGIFLHKESELMTGIMVSEQFPLEEVFFLVFLCYCAMIAFTGLPVLAGMLQSRGRNAAERKQGENHVS